MNYSGVTADYADENRFILGIDRSLALRRRKRPFYDRSLG